MEKKVHYYHKTISIWNLLCDHHKSLLDQTSKEYINLLSSEMEKVEDSIKEKEHTIKAISKIDLARNKLLEEINKEFSTNIQNFFELNGFFSDLPFEKENKHLNKFNQVLKECIKSIQEQNKTNQLFINKAIINLDKIKNAGAGNKNYNLYNSNGALKK